MSDLLRNSHKHRVVETVGLGLIDLNIVKSAHQHHRSLRVVLRLEKIALHVNDSKDLSALQNPASDVGVAGIVEDSVRDDHGHPTSPGLKQL